MLSYLGYLEFQLTNSQASSWPLIVLEAM